MSRTVLTADKGSFAVVPQSLTWTAGDVANGNAVASTAKELLVAWNTHGANAYYIKFYGANGETWTKTLAAGEFYFFGPVSSQGYKQSDNNLYMDVENASVKWAIIKLA